MMRYFVAFVAIVFAAVGAYAWVAAQPNEQDVAVGPVANDRFAALHEGDEKRAARREADGREWRSQETERAGHLATLNAQFAARFSALPLATLRDARSGRKPGTRESLHDMDALRLCIFGDRFIEIGRQGDRANTGYFVLDGKMVEATMFVRLQSNGAKAPVSYVAGKTLDRLDFETMVNGEESAGTVRIFTWNDQGPKLELSYTFTAPVECRVFGMQADEGY